MKHFLSMVFLVASCGKPAAKTNSSRPTTNQSEATARINITWREALELPDVFFSPPKKVTLLSDQRFLISDSKGNYYIIDSNSNSVVPSNIPEEALQVLSNQSFVQSSETSAWSLSKTELTRIEWGASVKDLKVFKVPLDSLFQHGTDGTIEFQSAKENSALLKDSSKAIHVSFNKTQRIVREFAGVNGERMQSAEFGHIFYSSPENTTLTRLLETEKPTWHRHALNNTSLPESTSFIHFDLAGSPDSVTLIGLAIAGKKVWISRPASLGSTTKADTPEESTTDSTKPQLSAETQSLFIKYCAGCHEGRAPVFVKTNGDNKSLLIEALLNDKDKVIRAMNLPQDNPKVMPPYGRPRPSTEELKTMSAL